jgi:hypothetical protein
MSRFASFPIRSITDSSEGLVIEGVANDVTVTDSYGTRFEFSEDCLVRSRGRVVLMNHGRDNVAGRNLEMGLLRDGSLWVKDLIDPDPALPNGLRYVDACRRNLVNGLSIRFDDGAEVRRGKEFDVIVPNYLPEHSLVTMPSNDASRFVPVTRLLESIEGGAGGGLELGQVYRLLQGGVFQVWDLRTRDTSGLAFDVLRRRLHTALAAVMTPLVDHEWDWDMHSVYPAAVIVYIWRRGMYWEVPYTLGSDGAVTLGTPAEVLPEWKAVVSPTIVTEPSRELSEVDAARYLRHAELTGVPIWPRD